MLPFLFLWAQKVFDKLVPQSQRPALVNKATPTLTTPGHSSPAANPILTYYFHPDHLGSSSYMSGNAGKILQYLEYLPFGEAMMDEHINSNNSPFKYNGKEFDEETGNYYYGARYYDPKLSNFISVDPLAEQTFSSYGYCYNNPIRFTDPTGMKGDDIVVTGADADLVVKELNDDSQLNLVRDPNTGKVTMADKSKINYNNLSCEDQGLYETIEDNCKTVNISTTQDMLRPAGNNQSTPFFIGSFTSATNSSSKNEINMLQAIGLENGGGQTAGTSIRHEIFEGSSAIDFINSPSPIPNNSGPNFVPPSFMQNVFNQAHLKAGSMDSNFSLQNTKGNQIYINMTSQPKEMWFNSNPNASPSTAAGWFKIQ